MLLQPWIILVQNVHIDGWILTSMLTSAYLGCRQTVAVLLQVVILEPNQILQEPALRTPSRTLLEQPLRCKPLIGRLSLVHQGPTLIQSTFKFQMPVGFGSHGTGKDAGGVGR